MVAKEREGGRKQAQDMGWPCCVSCQVPRISPPHRLQPGARALEDSGGGGGETGRLTLITEGSLPGSPLETLNNAVLH